MARVVILQDSVKYEDCNIVFAVYEDVMNAEGKDAEDISAGIAHMGEALRALMASKGAIDADQHLCVLGVLRKDVAMAVCSPPGMNMDNISHHKLINLFEMTLARPANDLLVATFGAVRHSVKFTMEGGPALLAKLRGYFIRKPVPAI